MRETHEKSKTGHVERKRFPFNVACFVILARHPSSGPGCARSTFPGGEGCLRWGTLYFSPSWTCRGPLHTRPCGATLSKQERAGDSRRGKRGRLPCVKGAVSRRLTEGSPCCRLGPPHTRQGFALPPSPRRGFFHSAPIRSRDSRRFPSSSTAIRSRTCSTSAFMSLASHSIRVPTMACL